MIAGTETTATLLSGVTYFLISNRDKLDKLVAELRTTFHNEYEITVEALARLKYLHACLEEGLRVYPPVPTGLPRVVPPGGAQICERWIPEGVRTTIYLSIKPELTHHRPSSLYIIGQPIIVRPISPTPTRLSLSAGSPMLLRSLQTIAVPPSSRSLLVPEIAWVKILHIMRLDCY